MESEPKPVFIALLRFSTNRQLAPQFMEGHKLWLKQGFDDGVFLLAGSLEPSLGGAIMTSGISRPEIERRIQKDPFVMEDIVSAEIIEIDPGRADERLNFLLPTDS